MIYKVKSVSSLAVVLITKVLCTGGANGALILSNLNISNNSFSVTMSGTLPPNFPSTGSSVILAVNPDQFKDPGFVIGSDFTDSTAADFSGDQKTISGRLGRNTYGDYVLLLFELDLIVGDDLNGSYTASWSSSAFAPSEITSLDFYWGGGDIADSPDAIVNGVFLGSVNVPEPSSICLLGCGVCCFASLRRRKRLAEQGGVERPLSAS